MGANLQLSREFILGEGLAVADFPEVLIEALRDTELLRLFNRLLLDL